MLTKEAAKCTSKVTIRKGIMEKVNDK
ncbi:hypothetical protein [Schaedlerella sp.]